MHFKLVCDGSGSVNSKVLHNSCWNWPSARSEELVEIQSGLLQVSLAQEDSGIQLNGYYHLLDSIQAFKLRMGLEGSNLLRFDENNFGFLKLSLSILL